MTALRTIIVSSVTFLLVGVVSADSIQVFPKEVVLHGSGASQSFIIQGISDDGLTSDLTKQVKITTSDTRVASVDASKLVAMSDGECTATITVNDKSFAIPVRVAGTRIESPLSFRLDVMPVLTKAGCNSGRCHGAARGKDGFQLSLYGFDPEGDHFRLTQELPGRRVNLARPRASLLMTKAIGEVAHTGGQRFEEDSQSYNTLVTWISQGANNDPKDIAAPTGIELFPKEAVLNGLGEEQSLLVIAHYSDGTRRDVTHLAEFLTNNDNSADVSEFGVITAGARGEAFVMARFSSFTRGIPVITLPRDLEFAFPKQNEVNYIDELVNIKLRKLRIQPSKICTDEQFLRRVTIDLTGLTPTPQEYETFVNNPSPIKREQLVDELLEREQFVDLWTMKLGELLKIRTSNQVSYKALLGFHNWLKERVSANTPLNELIGDVIGAEGGTFDSPPTNYYQMEANNRQIAENVAQSFLGMRIQCAQCHNHPFDRWTMDDYYGFTAFFSQIGFKQSTDPREYIIYSSGEGEVRHIVDDRVVLPKFLGDAQPDVQAKSRRRVLAEWIAAPDNPYLSRHLANVVWAHHFGRGIVEPVDDVRISNPAVNEPLITALGDRFKSYDYNLKSLVRDICLSETYQRSTQANDTNREDLTNFSKASIRRIRAEVLLDSISQITNTQDRFSRLPVGSRSVEIADGAVSNYFLSTFGRATRETVCSCEVEVEPTLSQAFHLLNGETTNTKIREGLRIQDWIENGQSPQQIIERIYIHCYSRKPTAAELESLIASIDPNKETSEELVDIFWAVLNSKEFIFNH